MKPIVIYIFELAFVFFKTLSETVWLGIYRN